MNIKENKNIKIKVASPENAAELLDIYKFYVENTAISFEIETPTLQEFRARIEKTLKKYPYLIAVSPEDEILGYAYAGELKSRAAYDWSIETSIYVKKECRKMGIGGILLKNLEFLLKKQNILNCYACIAYTEREEKKPVKERPIKRRQSRYLFRGRSRDEDEDEDEDDYCKLIDDN